MLQSGCFIIQLPHGVLCVYWLGYLPRNVFQEQALSCVLALSSHVQNLGRFRHISIVQTSRSLGPAFFFALFKLPDPGVNICSKLAKIPHVECAQMFKVPTSPHGPPLRHNIDSCITSEDKVLLCHHPFSLLLAGTVLMQEMKDSQETKDFPVLDFKIPLFSNSQSKRI